VVTHGVSWLRRRATRFDLTVCGGEYLAALEGRPFLITSNHIWPSHSPLGPLARVRFFRQYDHSADSFIFHRAVLERTGRTLHTAARCDRGRWASTPWKRRFQKNIGQPFAREQMGALPGYIAVEQNPGCCQRPFLDSVRGCMVRGEPLLMFPGGIALDRPDLGPELHHGAWHIARRHRVPILPACILGSDSWRPGHPVTVAFGPPWDVMGMDKGEAGREIIRRVQTLHAAHAPGHRQRARVLTQVTAAAHRDAQEASHVATT
jgi:hypothetical protein